MFFYGINPVIESLQSLHVPERIYVAEGKANPGINKILKLAAGRDVPIKRVPRVDKLCGSRDHQGVGAEIADLGVRSLPETGFDSDHIVMFDGLQDPHNFGAALRVCEAFGFRTVIFHKGNSSGVTAAAVKVSAGAVFHLSLYISNLNTAVKKLKREAYAIYCLDGKGPTDVFQLQAGPKFCLVIGSESDGVRFAIQRQADATVRIPMHGRIESLNVSCALSAALAAITARGR